MSLLVRRSPAVPSPLRAPLYLPYRYGEQPECEFPPCSPSDVDADTNCDSVETDHSPLIVDPFAQPLPTGVHLSITHMQCDDPLLRGCPGPPFDCSSNGVCLLTHPVHAIDVNPFTAYPRCHLHNSSLHTALSSSPAGQFEAGAGKADTEWAECCIEYGPRQTDQRAWTEPSERSVAAISSITCAPSCAPDCSIPLRPCRYDYRRVGRGPLPTPPWPFFSRSTSYERTSWTSLSAAAANRTDTPAHSCRQPTRPTQQHRIATRLICIRQDGILQAVLTFKTHAASAAASTFQTLSPSTLASPATFSHARAAVQLTHSWVMAGLPLDEDRSALSSPSTTARDVRRREMGKRRDMRERMQPSGET